MQPRLGHWLTAVRGQLPTLLTLIGLAALFTWGHASGWRLSGGKEVDDDDGDDKGAAVKEVNETAKVRISPDPTVPISSDAAARNTHLLRIEFPSEEMVARTGLVCAPVEVRTMADQVVANGVLAFDQTRLAQLSSRAVGTVWAVPKRAGDKVRAGEVLALVDSVEVGKAKSDLLQSLVQFELKRQLLERMRASDSSVPDRQLREAEAAYREARVRLLHDRQALANLGLPLRLEDFAGQSDEQVFSRMRVAGLPEPFRKEVEETAGSAGLLPLLAPFDGEVIRCTAVRGELASPSQSLFVVAATDPLWVLLDVRLEDMTGVRVNQPVTFHADAAGQESATGNLAWISAEADAKTRTVRARACLPNPAGRLRPNTFGTGRILVAVHAKAVVVPSNAIQWDGNTNLVFVRLSPTVFQARQVEIGLRDGDAVEVRRGVQPDEVVVTTGSHVLKSEVRKDLIADTD